MPFNGFAAFLEKLKQGVQKDRDFPAHYWNVRAVADLLEACQRKSLHRPPSAY
jgi:hypothetical protein